MLKSDLHLHSGEDKQHRLKYSAKELIAYAAKKGFEVLSLTLHNELFFNKELESYARKKGVLLIPGIELQIENKEVLIYNVTTEEITKLKTFEDLRKLRIKNNQLLVVAPHPFFKRGNCFGEKLIENIELFDAIEYSHFYLSFFNLNKKAVKIAKKYSLPLVGSSDTHHLIQLETTYSMIDSKKNIKAVIQAIKKNKVELKTKPVSLKYFIWRAFISAFKLE
ncbi:MAG: PHP domain-containing protein [Nanoarchaeota archaeon]|nr:PHP domain-containing protein [Nanoarchaeota archaeon]